MTKYLITAFPYATQYGRLEIPEDVEDVKEYIEDHWNEIQFEEPELDYCGTDFDYETDPED